MSKRGYTVQFGGLTFPPKVIEYFQGLGDRPAHVRAAEAAERATREYYALRSVFHKIKHDFEPKVMLDVGCGLAIVTALLADYYNMTCVHLIDGDGTLARRTGYKHDTEAWADVNLGDAMVRANTKESLKVVLYHSAVETLQTLDLVISLRSWGHHYPIDRYLFWVSEWLKPDGLLVLDIRNGTDGVSVLAASGFEVMAQVPDPSEKCRRLVFKRVK